MTEQLNKYCIAGMLGKVNVGKLPNLAKKFGKWIDFSHKDANYKLKFSWFKFSKSLTIS